MLSIRLHDGLYDPANEPYLKNWMPETKPRTSMVYILHQADMMAARIEFEKEWLPKINTSKDNTSYIHTTYQDNLKNLSESFLKQIEELKIRRPLKIVFLVSIVSLVKLNIVHRGRY